MFAQQLLRSPLITSPHLFELSSQRCLPLTIAPLGFNNAPSLCVGWSSLAAVSGLIHSVPKHLFTSTVPHSRPNCGVGGSRVRREKSSCPNKIKNSHQSHSLVSHSTLICFDPFDPLTPLLFFKEIKKNNRGKSIDKV